MIGCCVHGDEPSASTDFLVVFRFLRKILPTILVSVDEVSVQPVVI